MSHYKTFVDGQDISNRCVKCGSEAVTYRVVAKLQYASIWIRLLAPGSILLRTFYNSKYRIATLRLGFCKKHRGFSDILRILGVSLSAMVGCGLIGLGLHIQHVALQFLGCLAFIVLSFFVKAENIVKVKYINNGRVTIKTKI